MVTLVVEGGAMRAAYASGVIEAFQNAGFVPDAVYGTSAGAVLGGWYAAGLAHLGCRTWDHVGDRRIMSYRRALLGRGPVIDFRHLYSERYPNEFGMDVEALRRAPFPVHATVADADAAEPLYPDLRRVADPLAYLHATSAIPLVAEAPVHVDGRRLVDGGILDPIPIRKAVQDGATDVVLVLNRPPGERKAEPRFLAALVGRRFPALATAALRHHALHNDAVAFAHAPPKGVRVRIVRPALDPGVTRLTRDVAKVRAAVAQGRREGAAAAAAWGLGTRALAA
jgi:predicted patatin/cPLA2 family phospholipase